MPIRAILAKMRHDGCGGLAGKAELVTGIEGVQSAGAEDRAAGGLMRKGFALRLRVTWPLATYPRAEGAPAIWLRVAHPAVSAR